MIKISDEQFFGYINTIISRQSRITYSPDNQDYDIDLLIQDFKKAYKIGDHNAISDTASIVGLPDDLLCYDLMFLENPYDSVLRQRFFTFFSQDKVLERKRQVERIYSSYLANHPEYHIDTLLQISYCNIKDPKRFKFSSNQISQLQNGLCLPIPPADDDEIKGSPYYYIPITPKLTTAIQVINGRLKDFITDFVKRVYEDDESLQKDIDENIIPRIEKEINDYCQDFDNADIADQDFVMRAITGFVNGTYTNDIAVFKNIIRVVLVNLWAVNDLRYLYFIPIPFLEGKRIGHMAISSTRVIERNEIQRYVSLSYILMNSLVQRNVSRLLTSKNKREAIKSAKSAIMARNMSHNLGSHVMAYLKQKMGSVTSITSRDNNVLDYLEWTPTSVELPFLVGLGRFIGYIQERQDYIATIATDYIPYGAPVNLKDAIYDELNPDLRYIRHKDDTKNRPLNILLSYIAKSEGLSRENMATDFSTHNDILFSYVSYNNGKIEHFGRNQNECDSKNPALTEMRKINFSLPGGLVGRQALFSIIENIIRNAAKHGDRRTLSTDRNLRFEFDVIDGSLLVNAENAYSGSNVSSLSFGQQNLPSRLGKQLFELYHDASDITELFLLTITDNLDYSDDSTLIGRLTDAINEDYVDSDYRMKDTNKGIKELRISSAWMRGESDEELFRFANKDNSDRQLAPIVSVELSNENHLRYVFAIPKDRTVGFLNGIDNEPVFNALEKADPQKWHRFNSISEIKNLKGSYQFILVPPSSYNSLRPYVSNRLIKWKDNPTLSLEENTSVSNLEKKVLSLIYQLKTDINPDNSPAIYIWDKKTVDENEYRGEKPFDKIILSGASDVNNNIAQFAYRTHHSSSNDYRVYWEKKRLGLGYGDIESIDAITGDNSSDRLVRRESLDEQWYYSHLYALQQRVAIIDERIFRNIHKVDDASFTTTNLGMDSLREGLLEGTISLDEAIDKLIEIGVDYDDIEGRSINQMVDYLKCNSHSFAAKHIESDNQLTAFNMGRLVDVLTFVDNGKDGFALVGCTSCTSSPKDSRLFSYVFDCIATLRRDDNNPGKVRLDFSDDSFANRYSYISIHQGLLDKIYSHFGIKSYTNDDDSPKMETDNAKCAVTKVLFEKLMKRGSPAIRKRVQKENRTWNYEYLPNLIIHSGRSKPSDADMPQHQPFVQFSAIEHATKDCKYSLIQVLDYAKYE